MQINALGRRQIARTAAAPVTPFSTALQAAEQFRLHAVAHPAVTFACPAVPVPGQAAFTALAPTLGHRQAGGIAQ